MVMSEDRTAFTKDGVTRTMNQGETHGEFSHKELTSESDFSLGRDMKSLPLINFTKLNKLRVKNTIVPKETRDRIIQEGGLHGW